MSAQSSFWSRSYSIVYGGVALRLYFGEVKASEFARLLEEVISEFERLGVGHDAVVLSSNRAGMHFSNFLRMEPAACEDLCQKLEQLCWKASSD